MRLIGDHHQFGVCDLDLLDEQHTKSWIWRCDRMLRERRMKEKRARMLKAALAMAFFLRRILHRWRQRVKLRMALKSILKGAIMRWVIRKWTLTMSNERSISKLCEAFERYMLRIHMTAWWDVVEHCREMKARSHYALRLRRRVWVAFQANVDKSHYRWAVAVAHYRHQVMMTSVNSWRTYIVCLKAFCRSMEQAGARGRRRLLWEYMQRWANSAKELTLTLIWTNSSLHRALVTQWKRRLIIRWRQNTRISRKLRAVMAVMRLYLLRAWMGYWKKARPAEAVASPVKSLSKDSIPLRRGRPRRNVCKCVYDVTRCGKCRCKWETHLQRRLEACHDLIDEALTPREHSPGRRSMLQMDELGSESHWPSSERSRFVTSR